MEDNLIIVGDEEMYLLGKRIGDNLFLYEDKILRMIRTHQTESISYYVEDK